MSTVDPIDQLIASGIPARTLIAHFLISVEWLAAHAGDRFNLCYYDEAGSVVVEPVTGARALLQRAQELGWTPWDEEPTEKGAPDLFNETLYHTLRGVHWYSTAFDNETDESLPLGFPARMIEASRRRHAKKFSPEAKARRAKAEARKLQREAEAREKLAAAELRAATALAADDFIAAAKSAGKTITARTAYRKAALFIRKCSDWDYHKLVKRVRAIALSAKDAGDAQ